MTNCPHCGTKILFFDRRQSGVMCSSFFGRYDYRQDEFVEDYERDEFRCTNCDEIVTCSEDEADKMLEE